MIKPEIKKNSIVLYRESCWYKVTARFADSVNLGSPWGSKVYHKGVSINDVKEDEAAWYKNFQESETYKCM